MEQMATEPVRGHYRGSHIFNFVAKRAGFPLDQFNFLLAEVLALIFAFCFRRYLPPKPNNVIKRHLVGKTIDAIEFYVHLSFSS